MQVQKKSVAIRIIIDLHLTCVRFLWAVPLVGEASCVAGLSLLEKVHVPSTTSLFSVYIAQKSWQNGVKSFKKIHRFHCPVYLPRVTKKTIMAIELSVCLHKPC